MIRTILTVLFLAVFFVFSLPFYALLPLLARVNERAAARIAQSVVNGAFSVIIAICGIRVRVVGRENIPEGAVLFIGNHRSYFDIVTTYPRLPGLTGYVAKKEIDKISLLKWWMPLLHGLTFDRDDPRSGMKMILAAIDEIKAGYSVFIFPEGTRAKGEAMLDFKAGSFKVATRTNCPIVPVAITGTADIFENHIPAIRPSEVVIRFGEPIRPAALEKEEKKKIAALVQSRVEAMLKTPEGTADA